MKLIVQPDDGVAPVLTAIKQAKKSIDILIFRLDRSDLARALEAAVARGVVVRALTAHTNRGGEKHLRRLEMHLLEQGVTVSRTADDLVRYHGKMMIVDGRILHVYGFNFTTLDIEKSRSFGVVSRNRRLVQEATKLFTADFDRQPYTSGFKRLVVSPENSRERLADFLKGARRELLIYDPGLTDDGMLRILTAKIKAGVSVKIIGKVEAKWDVPFEKYPGKRLHVRTIVRDGQRAFVGSQSLRKLELDKRREVGVIITEKKVVDAIMTVFARDWAETPSGKKALKKTAKNLKAGKPLRPAEKLLASVAAV
jgi:phosphatidylserine/phosphatidylglycerophosphate/cardiolipin synthase-like enzyme